MFEDRIAQAILTVKNASKGKVEITEEEYKIAAQVAKKVIDEIFNRPSGGSTPLTLKVSMLVLADIFKSFQRMFAPKNAEDEDGE